MLKEEVEKVLEEIRPSLISDGGNVRLVNVSEDGIVQVELQGSCAGCPMSQMTLKQGIEARLKAKVSAVTSVVSV